MNTADDYRTLSEEVLALELELELVQILEAKKRGELHTWREIRVLLGAKPIKFDTPEEYERYIAQREDKTL